MHAWSITENQVTSAKKNEKRRVLSYTHCNILKAICLPRKYLISLLENLNFFFDLFGSIQIYSQSFSLLNLKLILTEFMY